MKIGVGMKLSGDQVLQFFRARSEDKSEAVYQGINRINCMGRSLRLPNDKSEIK
jgi:hypothetical protein